jgi:hypothetical protein
MVDGVRALPGRPVSPHSAPVGSPRPRSQGALRSVPVHCMAAGDGVDCTVPWIAPTTAKRHPAHRLCHRVSRGGPDRSDPSPACPTACVGNEAERHRAPARPSASGSMPSSVSMLAAPAWRLRTHQVPSRATLDIRRSAVMHALQEAVTAGSSIDHERSRNDHGRSSRRGSVMDVRRDAVGIDGMPGGHGRRIAMVPAVTPPFASGETG